ncbi:unnamed protein product, partial [Urochloa humidicola]
FLPSSRAAPPVHRAGESSGRRPRSPPAQLQPAPPLPAAPPFLAVASPASGPGPRRRSSGRRPWPRRPTPSTAETPLLCYPLQLRPAPCSPLQLWPHCISSSTIRPSTIPLSRSPTARTASSLLPGSLTKVAAGGDPAGLTILCSPRLRPCPTVVHSQAASRCLLIRGDRRTWSQRMKAEGWWITAALMNWNWNRRRR